MQKPFNFAILMMAAVVLLGNALAQTKPTTAPKTQPATAAKPKPKTATTAKSAAAPALTTAKDKFSYALGMNLGSGLHRQSMEINSDVFARGFKDAFTGGKTLMTEDEARNTLMQARQEMMKKEQEKQAAAGAANQKEGDAFLAANKAKEGVVTLPSGLQYKILQAGTGPKPTPTDTVVCNYKGTLINGTEFDSSYKRGEPATFPVSGVIKGWTEALQLMPVGSKWQLFVPAALAYGDRGAGPDIGPGSTLIFEVELMSIKPAEKPSEKPAEPATPPPDTKQ